MKSILIRLTKRTQVIFYVLLLSMIPTLVFAQTLEITGSVIDEDGLTIPGVNIQIVGTGNGAVTDIDGKYTISVESGETLRFSFLGYKDQEILITNQTVLDVTIEVDAVGLDEYVAIGYGTQKKGDVTSAISSVKSEDFTIGKIGDAAELVKGKIAGLSVVNSSGDPNDESSIMLRGVTTVLGGSITPLILVDGIEGSLSTVAPENIASFDVLKDASAAAIYGTRGANGVILITTKSGKRGQKAQVTYSGCASISNWFNKMDFMDAQDIYDGLTNYDYDGYSVDWLAEVCNDFGFKQNHSLSINGGTETTTYSANVTYSDEQGIMRKSDRDDIKTQLDFTQYAMNDILKFNVNLLYTTHNNTNNNNDYAYRQAVIRNPSSPVYHENGDYYEEYNKFQYYNPVEIQNELIGDTRKQSARIVGNITVEPIKGWKTNLMLSRRESETTSETYYTSKYYSNCKVDPEDQYRTVTIDDYKGAASKSSDNTRSDNLDLTSTYELTTDKHRLTALGGYSYLYNVNDGFSAGNTNFNNESYLYNSLGKGTWLKDEERTATMDSYKNDDKLIGFFGRVSYGYDDRYNVMVAFRHEGSSKFGDNYKWGNFPSASVGWTISNEDFMSDFSWLDNLKIRAGYGVTGVIPDDSYASLYLYNFDDYGDHLSVDGEWLQSLEITQNLNRDLKWETTREFSLGLDWTILSGRINGSFDVYNKKTSDLLYEYSVPQPPYIYGYTVANAGDMRNNGIEVMVSGTVVKNRDFEWTSTVTMSHNENKLLSLSNNMYETDKFEEVGGVGDPISVATHCMEVGHQMGDFWGLKSRGVSADGYVMVEISDGDGGYKLAEFSTDYNEEDNRQRLGNGMPKVYAGWNNTFSYKNFDLNLQFTGQFGYSILNSQRCFYENNNIEYNRLKTAAKYYGAIDTDGNPVIDNSTGTQKQVRLSRSLQQGVWSDHIEKGDFVKLTSATLGYTVPTGPVFKTYVQNIRVYVSGQNLFCITGYSGIDPEVDNYFKVPGIDGRDKYPTIRSFTFGLTANF